MRFPLRHISLILILMKLLLKICGVTRLADADPALNAGATALGLNFVSASPRYLADAEAAREIATAARKAGVLAVGVFVNADTAYVLQTVCECGLDAVQFHGDEPPEALVALRAQAAKPLQIWKALRVAIREDLRALEVYWPVADAVLLDARVPGSARGGTGQAFDWTILTGLARPKPLILAGGLTPENVAEAVRSVRPDGVDTASGVESAPGVKDAEKVRKFLNNARSACV